MTLLPEHAPDAPVTAERVEAAMLRLAKLEEGCARLRANPYLHPKALVHFLASLSAARTLTSRAIEPFVEAWRPGDPIPKGFRQFRDTLRQLGPGEDPNDPRYPDSPAPGLFNKLPDKVQKKLAAIIDLAALNGYRPEHLEERVLWDAWERDALALAWFSGAMAARGRNITLAPKDAARVDAALKNGNPVEAQRLILNALAAAFPEDSEQTNTPPR